MPRYYEQETLIEFVKKYSANINGETTLKCVEIAIRNAPTEDVVPRSEVKKIFEEIHKEIELALDSNYKARQEHIDKHFKGTLYVYDNFISLVDGKIQALRGIDDFINELEEKKYIGKDTEVPTNIGERNEQQTNR